jgi:hypothetical protein
MANDSQFDEVRAESVLGYGGMIVRDGTGSPLPLAEALALALPHLLEKTDRLDDVVTLLLGALRESVAGEPDVRITALKGLAAVAERHALLHRRAEVQEAIAPFLAAPVSELRAAASAVLRALSGESS